jgi:hypothetical protein
VSGRDEIRRLGQAVVAGIDKASVLVAKMAVAMQSVELDWRCARCGAIRPGWYGFLGTCPGCGAGGSSRLEKWILRLLRGSSDAE